MIVSPCLLVAYRFLLQPPASTTGGASASFVTSDVPTVPLPVQPSPPDGVYAMPSTTFPLLPWVVPVAPQPFHPLSTVNSPVGPLSTFSSFPSNPGAMPQCVLPSLPPDACVISPCVFPSSPPDPRTIPQCVSPLFPLDAHAMHQSAVSSLPVVLPLPAMALSAAETRVGSSMPPLAPLSVYERLVRPVRLDISLAVQSIGIICVCLVMLLLVTLVVLVICLKLAHVF